MPAFKCFKVVVDFGAEGDQSVVRAARKLLKLYIFYVLQNQAILHILGGLFSHSQDLEDALGGHMDAMATVHITPVQQHAQYLNSRRKRLIV